jgi:hypothetical protein
VVAATIVQGLDGVILNFPADGHDPDTVAATGAVVRAALPV